MRNLKQWDEKGGDLHPHATWSKLHARNGLSNLYEFEERKP
jgi:hypothetical protein